MVEQYVRRIVRRRIDGVPSNPFHLVDSSIDDLLKHGKQERKEQGALDIHGYPVRMDCGSSSRGISFGEVVTLVQRGSVSEFS